MKTEKFAGAALFAVVTLMGASSAQAGLIALPQATFGGSGIPNSSVAVTTITDQNQTITIGLTAHARYFNPAVTNNGVDRFFAGTGENTGGPGSPSATVGALWNFAFYADVVGGASLGRYSFDLLYDLDPGVGTAEAALGRIDLDVTTPTATVVENSQNARFSFLATGVPGLVTPPAFTPFNAFAQGEYTFILKVSDNTGELGRSTIYVDTRTVPEPTSLGLIGLGLAMVVRRMRK